MVKIDNHSNAPARVDQAKALAASTLAPIEREVLRMVNIERADIGEVAATLNQVQGSTAWDDARVCKVLAKAREKLTKAGELEASQPDAYVAQDLRARYDSLVQAMRAELRVLGDPRESPQLAPLRVKLLKQVAEVERMRDDALASLTGRATGQGAAFVYVSHLRDGATVAAGVSAQPGGKPIRVLPPPRGEE